MRILDALKKLAAKLLGTEEVPGGRIVETLDYLAEHLEQGGGVAPAGDQLLTGEKPEAIAALTDGAELADVTAAVNKVIQALRDRGVTG